MSFPYEDYTYQDPGVQYPDPGVYGPPDPSYYGTPDTGGEPPPLSNEVIDPGATQGLGGDYSSTIGALQQQDPTIWRYLKEVFNLSDSQISKLITMGGGVAGMVTSIRNGQLTSDAITNAVGQQAGYNSAAARETQQLSNPNISTPTQSINWTIGPDGRPTATQTYSPAQQKLLEGSQGLQGQGQGVAGQYLNQMSQQAGQPYGGPQQQYFDPSKLGAIQGGLDFSPAGSIQRNVNLGPIQNSVSLAGIPGVQYLGQNGQQVGGNIQTDPGAFGKIQNGLDYSSAPAMPTADAATRDKVTQAFFDRGYDLLTPELTNQRNDLNAMMSAQGIARNPMQDGAWSREQTKLDNSQKSQLTQLANQAVISGGDAMQQLYNMGLGARQQGVGEVNSQGQFANSAQNQGATQALAAMTARNAAQGQGYGQATGLQAANNAARAQSVNEQFGLGTFFNSAQAQGANQGFQNASLNNSGQAQGANQIAQQGTFANAAQGQGAGQYLAGTGLSNTAQNSQYGQWMQGQQLPASLYASILGNSQPVNLAAPQGTGATVQAPNAQTAALQGANAQTGGTGGALSYLNMFALPYIMGAK